MVHRATSTAHRLWTRSFHASVNASQGRRIVMLGKPGSGKGTHATNLQREFSFGAIDFGDLLRAEINTKSPIGAEIASIMKSGGLVSDDIMAQILDQSLNKAGDTDVLLTGYPRNASQAVTLDDLLKKRNETLDLVIHVDVPDEVILERIEGRWIHEPSQRVYNTTYNPPKNPGKDDITGEPLTKRLDDTVEIFSKRLETFRRSTRPISEYYDAQKDSKLVTVSGPTSAIIWPQIRDVLRNRLGLKTSA